MSTRFDLIIVGAGMVGATLACALAGSKLKVAVVEPFLPEPFKDDQIHDLRVSALNIASENILKNIGAWDGIINRRACVYKRLKTWEMSEEKAATLFDAAMFAKPAKEQHDTHGNHLGYIVENRVIQLALLEQMAQADNVTLINQKTLSIDYCPGASLIELASGEQIVGKLLVGADGGNSAVRNAAGIGIHSWDYQQSALVINVELDSEQQDITWQQFTPTGPLAFLPLTGNKGSLVWYNHPDKIKQLLQLDDEQLKAAIVSRFPASLAPVSKILAKAAFPLKRQHTKKYVLDGLALIGDAAHIIHPLAGQGVNIGLLDAAELAQTLLKACGANIQSADEYAHSTDTEIASLSILQQYERSRRHHNLAVMQIMDGFYHMFNNDITPLKILRNIGLGAAGKLPFAKRKVMALAMGMQGPLPDLARER
jgi:2-octaprenyl-3-methyl-6-methoxy-1,4-benzoquinol hydroxylase